MQWGIVNYEKGDFLGWQSAAVNYTDGMFTGFQSGWINYAGNLNGFQLGLVNIADQAKAALQIGLVNIIQQNTMWFRELPDALAPGMVIANWRFLSGARTATRRTAAGPGIPARGKRPAARAAGRSSCSPCRPAPSPFPGAHDHLRASYAS